MRRKLASAATVLTLLTGPAAITIATATPAAAYTYRCAHTLMDHGYYVGSVGSKRGKACHYAAKYANKNIVKRMMAWRVCHDRLVGTKVKKKVAGAACDNAQRSD
ncbi:hypothetical protein [Streptomyces sp. WAC01526]|uniref:hypothetical protein n=1 Tax=Streptomyces sp. WAC01526 TaxID=2588709 RepID=UPI0016529465|nr:hypothetical protein [Streptomyces sp. WAC01526]